MRQTLAAFVFFIVIASPILTFAESAQFQSAVLDNGLRIVVIPNHRMPIITHMVWYHVGAIDETQGKSGIAHFLEHLMFKGTPNVPAGEFSKRIAGIGGSENAFTTSDYTVYFQSLSREHLALAMELEADRMANLSIGEDDFAAEKKVVLEERRARIDNNPDAILAEEMQAALWRNHPYGRPLIGWANEILSQSRADALAWHRRYYAPNNAVVVIAGDATLDDILPLAEKFYGAIAPRDIERPEIIAEPDARAKRELTMRSPRVRQVQFMRMIAAPGYYTADDRKTAYALEVLANILGGQSGLLHKHLVVADKIAVAAAAWYDPDKRGPTVFGIAATPTDLGKKPAVALRISAILSDLERNGVAPDVLNRAKNQLVAESIYARDSNYRMAYAVGETLIQGGDINDLIEWDQRIAAVTIDDIRSAAKLLIDEKRAVDGWLLPEVGKNKSAEPMLPTPPPAMLR